MANPYQSFIEKLEANLPVFQAPLPFQVIQPEMSGQISALGAVGMLHIAEYSNVEVLENELNQYKKHHERPAVCFTFRLPKISQFFLNEGDKLLQLAQKYAIRYPLPKPSHFLDLLDLVLAYNPRVIGFANGIPERDLIKFIKSRNITTFAVCRDLSEALTAADFGVDSLVLQGGEAGGEQFHFENSLPRLNQSGLNLLQQIRNKVDLPLILWTSITHGTDILGAIISGAASVMMDKAFVRCAIGDNLRNKLDKKTEYDFMVNQRFTKRNMRYIPSGTELPDFSILDKASAQAMMDAYLRSHPDRLPLPVSAPECNLPPRLREMLEVVENQFAEFLG